MLGPSSLTLVKVIGVAMHGCTADSLPLPGCVIFTHPLCANNLCHIPMYIYNIYLDDTCTHDDKCPVHVMIDGKAI